jgi:hypothetical protein
MEIDLRRACMTGAAAPAQAARDPAGAAEARAPELFRAAKELQ